MKMMILQLYAPTNDATEEDKGEFYELQEAKERISKDNIITCITVGDFNAKVGNGNSALRGLWGEGMK